ncbi:MAG TPA: chemotaxis protein CheA [Anaeromyxobacteraceae bacterium]|nr:chemotaxis protein CheA [Anaeromyxobacteraceae bacterium]
MADRRSEKALAEFVSEAQEIIDTLGRDLLHLESARHGGEADPQVLNAVFRCAHTLKGLASMAGVERMARLAHALEDLLDDLRMERRRLDAGALDLLLEAPEVFARIIGEVAEGGGVATAGAAEALASRLREAAPAPAAAAPDLAQYDFGGEVLGILTEYEEHRLKANVAKGTGLYRVRASFPIETFDQGLSELQAALKPLGEVISTLPAPGGEDPAAIAFDLLFASRQALSEIQGAVGAKATAGEVPRRAPPAGAAPTEAPRPPPQGPEERPAAGSKAALPPPESPEGTLRSASQAVRVDIRKLDGLMNSVGELLLIKTSLLRLAERMRAGEEVASLGLELQREGRALERRLRELQGGILEVRMVPLSQIFDKLQRMVRKIARETGKEVDFHVAGGDVELDKLIVEELSDPLMHLLRNAIDHGIEPPDERAQAGKPRAGRLELKAVQLGNAVEITVADDGRGIDEERVGQVAVERGLATPQALEELSRRELLNLIFIPGFSTAKRVTSLSGRGVGMDVVKNNIAALSGIIELGSEKGRGTRFEVTLPVTLAIVRALVVEAAGRPYAMPLNSVLEIVQAAPGDVRTIETREVLSLRGTTLPLLRLSWFLGLLPDAAARRPQRPYVVVVGLAQQRLGIAVDDLLGQQDIVVKPLGRSLEGVQGIAGATDLGGRRTVLVLDVGAILEEVFEGGTLREATG